MSFAVCPDLFLQVSSCDWLALVASAVAANTDPAARDKNHRPGALLLFIAIHLLIFLDTAHENSPLVPSPTPIKPYYAYQSHDSQCHRSTRKDCFAFVCDSSLGNVRLQFFYDSLLEIFN